jgi:hypothetical protein
MFNSFLKAHPGVKGRLGELPIVTPGGHAGGTHVGGEDSAWRNLRSVEMGPYRD